MSHAEQVDSIIRAVVQRHVSGSGRLSESGLVPSITDALRAEGFAAAKFPIPDGKIVIGRHPDSEVLLEPKNRTIDIGVLHEGRLCALVESEHDVADAVDFGARRKRRGGDGNYAVDSLARRGDLRYFRSYLSLERMAFVAMSLSIPEASPNDVTALLATIASDEPREHNPTGLALYLVVEVPDSRLEILVPRMKSLACRAIVAGRSIERNP